MQHQFSKLIAENWRLFSFVIFLLFVFIIPSHETSETDKPKSTVSLVWKFFLNYFVKFFSFFWTYTFLCAYWIEFHCSSHSHHSHYLPKRTNSTLSRDQERERENEKREIHTRIKWLHSIQVCGFRVSYRRKEQPSARDQPVNRDRPSNQVNSMKNKHTHASKPKSMSYAGNNIAILYRCMYLYGIKSGANIFSFTVYFFGLFGCFDAFNLFDFRETDCSFIPKNHFFLFYHHQITVDSFHCNLCLTILFLE